MKIWNKCNLYTAMWCLYYLQGTLYPAGGSISKILLFILAIWSLGYLLESLKIPDKPIYLKGLLGMILVYLVYWFVGMLSTGFSNWSGDGNLLFIKNLCLSTFPIFAYIHFSKEGFVTERWLLKWLPLFLLVAIFSFYNEQTIRLQAIFDAGGERNEVVNNSGYLFVSLIPYCLFFKKKPQWEVLILLICIFFVFMSVKRGAILVTSISITQYIMFRMKDSKQSNKIITLIIIAVVAVIAFYFLSSFAEQSELFSERLARTKSGDSSGRDEMWGRLYHFLFYDNSFSGMLFGNGVGGTVRVIGDGAHNDWLQIAVDMGLIGIISYLIYWTCFFKSWRRLKRVDDVLYIVFGILFVSELLKTIFSFSFNAMPIYALPLFGYCINTLRRNHNTIRKQ